MTEKMPIEKQKKTFDVINLIDKVQDSYCYCSSFSIDDPSFISLKSLSHLSAANSEWFDFVKVDFHNQLNLGSETIKSVLSLDNVQTLSFQIQDTKNEDIISYLITKKKRLAECRKLVFRELVKMALKIYREAEIFVPKKSFLAKNGNSVYLKSKDGEILVLLKKDIENGDNFNNLLEVINSGKAVRLSFIKKITKIKYLNKTENNAVKASTKMLANTLNQLVFLVFFNLFTKTFLAKALATFCGVFSAETVRMLIFDIWYKKRKKKKEKERKKYFLKVLDENFNHHVECSLLGNCFEMRPEGIAGVFDKSAKPFVEGCFNYFVQQRQSFYQANALLDVLNSTNRNNNFFVNGFFSAQEIEADKNSSNPLGIGKVWGVIGDFLSSSPLIRLYYQKSNQSKYGDLYSNEETLSFQVPDGYEIGLDKFFCIFIE